MYWYEPKYLILLHLKSAFSECVDSAVRIHFKALLCTSPYLAAAFFNFLKRLYPGLPTDLSVHAVDRNFSSFSTIQHQIRRILADSIVRACAIQDVRATNAEGAHLP